MIVECVAHDVDGSSARGDAGTYPSHQRWFLPVLPTTLARLLLRSQAERKAQRSYPTDQVRRKEKRPHPSHLQTRPYALSFTTVTPSPPSCGGGDVNDFTSGWWANCSRIAARNAPVPFPCTIRTEDIPNMTASFK